MTDDESQADEPGLGLDLPAQPLEKSAAASPILIPLESVLDFITLSCDGLLNRGQRQSRLNRDLPLWQIDRDCGLRVLRLDGLGHGFDAMLAAHALDLQLVGLWGAHVLPLGLDLDIMARVILMPIVNRF